MNPLTLGEFGKEFCGEGRLSCSIGTGDDEGGWSGHGLFLIPRLEDLDEGVLGDVDFAEGLPFFYLSRSLRF